MTDWNLDHLPEVTSTRLGFADRLRALPKSARHALRRLAGRGSRYYLTINGDVASRFVSENEHMDFMTWLYETHTAAFDYGFDSGRRSDAQHLPDDAGDAGTA